MLVLAGMALPVAATYLLLQPARHLGVSHAYAIALALGIGLGVASCTFFLALVLFDGTRAGAIAIDAALLLVGLIVWRRAGPPFAPPRTPRSSSERVLAVAVLVAAVAGATSFLANSLDTPHGRWDAWATWNVRARWLADASPVWREAFARPAVHGDYPLLLPASVARLWVYAGARDTVAPPIVGAAYATALVLLLYAALASLRGRAQALVGAMCLLGTPVFLRLAPWQYADVPLAFNLLAVLASLALYDQDPARRRPVLAWAGVAAGLAAWTKNEGLMLLLVIVVVRAALMIVRRAPDLRAAAWFVAGLLPPAAVGLYFRTALAPRSPQFRQKADTMLGMVLDSGRYVSILRDGVYELARGMGPLLVGLLVYALLLGRTRDSRARGMVANSVPILIFAILGYGFSYLTVRGKLTWVTSHSMDRLEMHLWPSILLVFFMYVGSPTEQEAALRQAPVDRKPARASRRHARRPARK